MADLTYNILEHSLTGAIDGTRINAKAVSGGRAGSKTDGAVNPLLANNPYLTGVKLSGGTPGGTLPQGTYTLRTHEKRKNWIRLVPRSGAMHGRAGFAIHGRGKRGSDGCIVPWDFHNVLLLYKLTKAREAEGASAPTLEVIAVGDADAPIRLMDRWARTA